MFARQVMVSRVSANGMRVPAGRSYDGNAWEGVPPMALRWATFPHAALACSCIIKQCQSLALVQNYRSLYRRQLLGPGVV